MKQIDLSIVVPAYNEEKNMQPLYEKISAVMQRIKRSYEIIFVDDGSTDGTLRELEAFRDSHVIVIKFRKNFGQTAALDAGFKSARGKILVPLDADLQNDPEDIPRLVAKLEEGYDVVSGWRVKRRDSWAKKIVSRGANLLRKVLLQDTIHDSGCTLKAYRRECFEHLTLYGEMHRFIPALLGLRGFKITELQVRHHPRAHGKTKYSIKRVVKGFLDMLVVTFWMKYSTRPIHLFGTLGIFTTFIGFLIGVYLTVLKLFFNEPIGNRPLLLLTIMLIVLGAQFVIFGLMSDILVKIYYKNEPTYAIEKMHKKQK
ncbi:MAG: glycosyltransferase family 2 protein [Candidatus Woesearchaeota archaeon]|nr:glycosyltransferase family 2 protein [Candidatus Woesearchaeota archaeon]